jgi:hypothetical protein
MDSKADKETVIPTRKQVEISLDRYTNELEQVKKFGNYKDAGSSLHGELFSLLEICQAVKASIETYNTELLRFNEAKVQERNELEKRRKAMSDGIALN